jgi:membrane protein DedA with SNARE-associated domain
MWVGTWVSIGYLADSHIDTIYNYITRYSYYALIVLAVVTAALIARHLLRRRRARRDQESRGLCDAGSLSPGPGSWPRST